MENNNPSSGLDSIQQPILQSIALHLLPGVLTTFVYVITMPFFHSLGYPSNLSFLLAVLFVLVPFELGYLIYLGRRGNGVFSLNGIVLYREPMPIRQYALLATPILLYANFILVVVYPPIAQMLIETLFSWLPDWYFMSLSLNYTKSILLMTALLGLVINGFVAPIAEELYFRGYLLPRISRLKAWAPFINAVLHSCYHLWMPWQVPGLIVMGLPAAYIIWRKQNIYLGMIIHVLGNVLGSMVTLASILSLP